MTEPRIQYARTEDGVSIAYYTMGAGTPFVHLPDLPVSLVQLESEGTFSYMIQPTIGG